MIIYLVIYLLLFVYLFIHFRLTCQLQVTDFTLDNTYTPFYFSRVKSYSLPII